MKSRWIPTAMATMIACLLAVPVAHGQSGSDPTPQMAREVFSRVPALGGVPVDEFMDTMGMISASLSLTCSDCHTNLASDGGWEAYADETPMKQTARRMIQMVRGINMNSFAGAESVTCYTCHRGQRLPDVVPSLDAQYAAPEEDPNAIVFPREVIPGMLTADQILDRHVEALGGTERLAEVTSFVAMGTYTGYDTEQQTVPVEVFAQAPARLTTIVQAPFGQSIRNYDGRAGWIAAPDRTVPLMQLTGGNLDGARLDAMLSFPAQIRATSSEWRVGFPTYIEDREVQVVQGSSDGKTPVNFYFDEESGLLVRLVRFAETPIGRVPTQIDYADYREVDGIQMPFEWTVTWTDGRSTTELSDIRLNVPIDAAVLSRPAPSPPPRFQ